MGKKDYEAIAGIIRKSRILNPKAAPVVDVLMVDLADLMQGDNPRFDPDRFYAACRGEYSKDSAGRKVRYSARQNELEIARYEGQKALKESSR